jgi:hypothetical protein
MPGVYIEAAVNGKQALGGRDCGNAGGNRQAEEAEKSLEIVLTAGPPRVILCCGDLALQPGAERGDIQMVKSELCRRSFVALGMPGVTIFASQADPPDIVYRKVGGFSLKVEAGELVTGIHHSGGLMLFLVANQRAKRFRLLETSAEGVETWTNPLPEGSFYNEAVISPEGKILVSSLPYSGSPRVLSIGRDGAIAATWVLPDPERIRMIRLGAGRPIVFEKDGSIVSFPSVGGRGSLIGVKPISTPALHFRPPGDLFVVDRETFEVVRFSINGASVKAYVPAHPLIAHSREFFNDKRRRHVSKAAETGDQPSGQNIAFMMAGCSALTAQGTLTILVAPVSREAGARFVEVSDEGVVLQTFSASLPDRTAQPSMPGWLMWSGRRMILAYPNGSVETLTP